MVETRTGEAVLYSNLRLLSGGRLFALPADGRLLCLAGK